MRVVVDCQNAGAFGKSRTRQSETASTDLNVALSKYRKSGVVTGCMASVRRVIFGDFSESPKDFLSAQVAIADARCHFAGLPARVREKFGNDPVNLLAFLADPKNLDAAVELGLCERPSPEASQDKPAAKDADKGQA